MLIDSSHDAALTEIMRPNGSRFDGLCLDIVEWALIRNQLRFILKIMNPGEIDFATAFRFAAYKYPAY